jgi:hypothetical protein
MVRRVVALALSLPLMIAGGVAAHAVAYALAVPNAAARQSLEAATGHAYTAWLPALIGVTGGVALIAVAALALGRGSLVERVRLRPEAFVLLPMAAFAIQEVAERAMAGYGTPWHVWQEPTFWRGLVLQVPFGLAALIVATILLGTARILHRAVARRREPVRAPSAVRRPAVPTAYRPVLRRLVRGGDALRFRGPPLATLHRP